MRQTKQEKQLDKELDRAWSRIASGVQVDIMDLSRIRQDTKQAITGGATVDEATTTAMERYRKN